MAVMTEDTLDIPINIGWALNQVIGAYSFKLTFDPLVFEATAVAGGTTSEFAGAPTAGIDNDNGYVSFNSFKQFHHIPGRFCRCGPHYPYGHW